MMSQEKLEASVPCVGKVSLFNAEEIGLCREYFPVSEEKLLYLRTGITFNPSKKVALHGV